MSPGWGTYRIINLLRFAFCDMSSHICHATRVASRAPFPGHAWSLWLHLVTPCDVVTSFRVCQPFLASPLFPWIFTQSHKFRLSSSPFGLLKFSLSPFKLPMATCLNFSFDKMSFVFVLFRRSKLEPWENPLMRRPTLYKVLSLCSASCPLGN